ncbi:MAG: serine protease [Verrucomicrobiales bacterium]
MKIPSSATHLALLLLATAIMTEGLYAQAEPPAAIPESRLIRRGQEGWRYLDTGEAPGEGWRAAEFDDSKWGSGAAPLGYGEDDVTTEISFGGEPEDKFAAAYFRLTFDAPDSQTDTEPVKYGGRVRFDDGVILYLNGTEIFRMNMPREGQPGHQEFSTGKVSSSSRWEGRYEKFFISRDAVLPGRNILAAEVHQSDAGSSDLILDFELAALTSEDARLEAIPELFTSPEGNVTEPVAGDEIYLDDLEVVRNIAIKGKELLMHEKAVAGRTLLREMENNRQHSILNLPIGGLDELSPAEIYKRCAPAVLIISPVSDSSDPNHPGEGWGSGFIISDAGVAVTNWHVIEAMSEADVITATTFDGRVFPLTKVLAARKDEDVAVVQFDTMGEKLVSLPLASGAHIGEPVCIIAHPRTNFFNLTQGYVSRYFKSRTNGARLISVSAEIAGGSSGGPILNKRGEVVGVVSMTESLSANPVFSQRTRAQADETDPGDEPSADDVDPDAEENEETAPPAQQERQQRVRVVPSSHQMTMKFGTPAVSVLELLE